MDTSDIIIRLGAIAGAIVSIYALLKKIVSYLTAVKTSLDTIASLIKRSDDTEQAIMILMKDRLSMIANLVIQRDWHTLTERQVLESGLKTYKNLGGNSQLGVKVQMALSTEVKVDPYYERGLEKEKKDEH